MFQARLISVPDHTSQLQHVQRKRVLRYYLPISTCLPCVMAAHTCLCALILLSLFTLGGFVSGSEYSSLTNYIYADLRIWVMTLTGINSLIFRTHICIVNSTYEVERRHTSDGELCTIVIALLRLSSYC